MKYAEALYHSNFDTNAVVNSITIKTPSFHKTLSGNETIAWNAVNSGGTVEIWYSSDGGNNWQTITKNAPNNGSYNWDTQLFSDGSFAKLLLCIKNPSGFIYGISESEYFTVNNPGNGAPFVKILNSDLHPGILVTDKEYNFNLLLGDPENDPLLIKVSYSINSDTLFHISQNINVASDTSIQIIPVSLNIIPNSEKLRIKLEVTDGVSSYIDITQEFSKQTPRQILHSQNLDWIRHYAEVPVEIRVIDSTQFKGKEYIITFSDIIPNALKTFSVFNKTTNQYTVLNEPLYPKTESLAFDGMVLYTEDILTDLDVVRSHWSNIIPLNLQYNINQFVSQNLSAYRYPFDYKLVFSFTFNDSSNYLNQIFGSGAPPINPHINFKVYRSVSGMWERTQFAFSEPSTKKDTLSNGDIVVLSNPDGNEFSWRVIFSGESTSNIPWGGDTLYLYTKKGLSVFDTLYIHGLTVDVNDKLEIPAEYSLSQNYPNPFNPNTKISYSIASMGRVTLKIYNILGREISTLVNEEKPAGKYEVNFNASSLASGVYFYQLKASDYIQTKKMLLLK